MFKLASLSKHIFNIISKKDKEKYIHYRLLFRWDSGKSEEKQQDSNDSNKSNPNDKGGLSNILKNLGIMKARPSKYSKNNRSEKRFEKMKVQLELLCLSPSLAFRDLRTKNVRNIILSSGTLSPFRQVESQLGFEFDIKKSFKPVADIERNFFSSIITKHCKFPEFKFTKQDEYQTEIFEYMIERLGEAIHEIVNVTPNGVLIFFSSYRVYHNCLKVWLLRDFFSILQRKKKVYFEEPGVDLTENLKGFERDARTINGAILLGVCGGRMSEGFNFSDELARAVIIVGVPFKNIKSYKIALKRDYLNNKTDSVFKGNEWYSVQAIRAINQAVGRVLRHSRDWGAAFIFDVRMKRQIQYLSKWIRTKLITSSMNEVLPKYLEFLQQSHDVFDYGSLERRREHERLIAELMENPFELWSDDKEKGKL